jgi:hypothetical protein
MTIGGTSSDSGTLQLANRSNFRSGSGTDGKACPQLRQLFPEAATGGYKVGNQFPRNSVRGRQIAIRRWVAWSGQGSPLGIHERMA